MRRIRLFFFLFTTILFSCSKEVIDGQAGGALELPAEAVHALETEADLDILVNEIGNARIVLLGEASHGTSEFYTWRTSISKKLIQEKGFTVIAVEGDWADAYPLNDYIKGGSRFTSAEQALQEFDRWPSWMWANEEVADLAKWLKANNSGKSRAEQVSFYGLDVYGLWESLDEVHEYLKQTDPETAKLAQAVLDCFAPYKRNEQAYLSATSSSSENCADELASLLQGVQNKVTSGSIQNEDALNALQNVMVAVNGERYYRAAARSSITSWNIRDKHMTETINRLLEHHGPDTKIIIWEHNTHVGDARATDMANVGMVNVGQLVREQHGENTTYIIGLGTYSGTVIAAQSWGSQFQVMKVPNAQRNSWEWVLHRQDPLNKIIFLDRLQQNASFMKRIGHRAIGVVYDPNAESGNYVPSVLPQRYDAFIFIDKTKALKPLQP